MRGAGGIVAVAILLVCCKAEPHQDPDSAASAEANESKAVAAALPGSLLRPVREARHRYYSPYAVAFGGKRGGLWPMVTPLQYAGYYEPKRNFDEIDRSDLDNFMRKRNFDEIDLSAMGFPGRIDKRAGWRTGLEKGAFDEIDLSSMGLPGHLRATKRVMNPFSPNFIAAYDITDEPATDVPFKAYEIYQPNKPIYGEIYGKTDSPPEATDAPGSEDDDPPKWRILEERLGYNEGVGRLGLIKPHRLPAIGSDKPVKILALRPIPAAAAGAPLYASYL